MSLIWTNESLLRGYGIRLKLFNDNNVLALREIRNDLKTMSHLGQSRRATQGGWSEEDILKWGRSKIELYNKRKCLPLVIVSEIDGAVMGNGGFPVVNMDHFRAESGVVLHHKYWRKGIGSASWRLILEYGFKEMLLNRITFETSPDNQASVSLFDRLNIPLEATQKESVFVDGKFYDKAVYVILRNQWPEVKQKLDEILEQKGLVFQNK